MSLFYVRAEGSQLSQTLVSIEIMNLDDNLYFTGIEDQDVGNLQAPGLAKMASILIEQIPGQRVLRFYMVEIILVLKLFFVVQGLCYELRIEV
jgi:hypothetical protein